MAKGKTTNNDWWNTVVGSSMLLSSIGSAITVGLNVVNTFFGLATGSKSANSTSDQNYYNSFYGQMRTDQMYTRVSKYPSSTTVSYLGM